MTTSAVRVCRLALYLGGQLLAVTRLAGQAVAPEGPNVRGLVISPAGAPVANVEVRLDGGKLATHTNAEGLFSFVDAPKGLQTLRFRRIGFLPATLTLRVPDVSDTLNVMMVPATQMLDTVQVVAKVNVLAGVVLDSKNRRISGVMVDIIGSRNAATVTDDGGAFTFTSVKNGTVVVRARKPGYEMATYSLQLEDWRGVILRMDSIDTKLRSARRALISGIGPTVEYTWKETQQRIAMRSSRATIVTREELAPLGDLPLGQAILQTSSAQLIVVDLQNAINSTCVLEDGRTIIGSTTLDSWRTNDVDFVELYPPGTDASGTVARYMRSAGCRGTRTVGLRARGPFFAVVWLR